MAASRPTALPPVNRRLLGLLELFGSFEEKKKFSPPGNQTTISVRSSPQPSHYTDYVILVVQSVQYPGCGLYDPLFDVWQGQQILALFEAFRLMSVPNQHYSWVFRRFRAAGLESEH